MSGLVALLVSMELLGSKIAQASMSRRVAFAALAGEPWGFMGSKQLLWQLHQGSDSLDGLQLSSIDQVPHACVAATPVYGLHCSNARP